LLGNKNYKALAKKLGANLEQVLTAEEEIKTLDPKPGRNFSAETTQYISPDIYIIQVDDDYAIILNEDGLPKLRINSFYRQAVSNPNLAGDGAKEFIQDKLRSAVWLIRSIHQRQRTIYKVTESIARRQRDFLDDGITHLKPMVLRDVAEDVEMHESTVSRVTTNKYVHTPQGIFELKFFFNSAIQRFHGEALASESVKERIRQILGHEDPRKPLSDDQIMKILAAENIDIARRTVAKYREILGILPSSKRRKPFPGKKAGP
jgi:RNA polymerase sigma-54 factor